MMLDHLDQMPPADASDSSNQKRNDDVPRTGTLILCDTLSYEEGWILQRTCRAERAAGRCRDLLLLMEHSPVFTAGRTTKDHHWPGEDSLAHQTGIPVIRTERGGSITYHGPGQVIGYPILRLADYCAGPKAYVHRLEGILIATLAEWEITGHRLDRFPGVWVGGDSPSKIASIGVRISQGITTHGFALNVSVDLAPFSHIVPCGIADCRVTSMAKLMGNALDPSAVPQRVAANFAEGFDLTWSETVGPERLVSIAANSTVSRMTLPDNAQFSHEERRDA